MWRVLTGGSGSQTSCQTWGAAVSRPENQPQSTRAPTGRAAAGRERRLQHLLPSLLLGDPTWFGDLQARLSGDPPQLVDKLHEESPS